MTLYLPFAAFFAFALFLFVSSTIDAALIMFSVLAFLDSCTLLGSPVVATAFGLKVVVEGAVAAHQDRRFSRVAYFGQRHTDIDEKVCRHLVAQAFEVRLVPQLGICLCQDPPVSIILLHRPVVDRLNANGAWKMTVMKVCNECVNDTVLELLILKTLAKQVKMAKLKGLELFRLAASPSTR